MSVRWSRNFCGRKGMGPFFAIANSTGRLCRPEAVRVTDRDPYEIVPEFSTEDGMEAWVGRMILPSRYQHAAVLGGAAASTSPRPN